MRISHNLGKHGHQSAGQIEDQITAATHGVFDATLATVARHSDRTVAVRRSAEPWLIPLVIALFLAEVFVRRRYLGD